LRNSILLEILFIILIGLLSGLIYNSISATGIPILYRTVETTSDQYLDVQQMEKIIAGKRALIIDARSPEEYNSGHLQDAVNIPGYAPVGQIMGALVDISKDRLIVAYCSGMSCPFADRIAGFLRFQDYRAVFVFPGGIEAWTAAGNSLIK
jgi:rhodanese-related sulfurtransferase